MYIYMNWFLTYACYRLEQSLILDFNVSVRGHIWLLNFEFVGRIFFVSALTIENNHGQWIIEYIEGNRHVISNEASNVKRSEEDTGERIQ
jgi:hypothetical protein